VVCWGADGVHHDRERQVVALLRRIGVHPMQLGLTKNGHPRHPLYLKNNAVPSRFYLPAKVGDKAPVV
jgi:hypothetical protein